jgi:hypothetical protein
MSLTPGQLAKLRQDISRKVDYLYRLTDRMEREQFPTQDEMRVKGLKARRAMEQLLRAVPIKPLRNSPFKDPPR